MARIQMQVLLNAAGMAFLSGITKRIRVGLRLPYFLQHISWMNLLCLLAGVLLDKRVFLLSFEE